MTAPGEPRAPRPAGVAVLGVVLLLVGLALLLDGGRLASRHPGEIFTPAGLAALLPGRFLPAVWATATGVGLLRGGGWARASFFAMAALVLVAVAGVLTGGFPGPRDYLRAGALLSVAAVTGWGVWYLLGDRAKSWLR